MRAHPLLAALLLAGCASDAPAPEPETQELYVGGGVVQLDAERRADALPVTVWENLTALRMELVVHAVASQEPRVFGVPGCEWRVHTVVTATETVRVDCFPVTPGSHLAQVEHDGGELRVAVRFLGIVAAP